MAIRISNIQCKQDEAKNINNNYIAQIDILTPSLLKKYCITGAAISVIDNGQAIFIKEYGLSDKKCNIPVEVDTCFQVASVSKTLTAWGIMKLIEKGLLSLDDPLGRYLTRWKIPPSPYNNDEVTIKRVLNHTAGFSVEGYTGVTRMDKLCTLEESLISSKHNRSKVIVADEPGKKFKYSGVGYTVLQLLIEEVTGIPYSKYMRDEILLPLGMNHSTFDLDDGLEYKVSKAYGFFGRELPRYYFTELAAAGMYSTIKDLTKFVEANIDGIDGNLPGRKVLSPQSVSMMHKRVNRIVPYGMGYYVINLPRGHKIVAHAGKNKGWNVNFAIFPNQKKGLVVCTNSSNGGGMISELTRLWIESIIGCIPEFYIKAMKMGSTSRFVSMVEDISMMLRVNNFFR